MVTLAFLDTPLNHVYKLGKLHPPEMEHKGREVPGALGPRGKHSHTSRLSRTLIIFTYIYRKDMIFDFDKIFMSGIGSGLHRSKLTKLMSTVKYSQTYLLIPAFLYTLLVEHFLITFSTTINKQR